MRAAGQGAAAGAGEGGRRRGQAARTHEHRLLGEPDCEEGERPPEPRARVGHARVPPVLALPKLPLLAAEVGVRQAHRPDHHQQKRRAQPRRLTRVRVAGEIEAEHRRQQRPVRVDEPKGALRQADQPEADAHVGEEERVGREQRPLDRERAPAASAAAAAATLDRRPEGGRHAHRREEGVPEVLSRQVRVRDVVATPTMGGGDHSVHALRVCFLTELAALHRGLKRLGDDVDVGSATCARG